LDVTNALTVTRCISNALDGSEDDILWEDDGEYNKDDSDRVTNNDSVMSDDGESEE